MGRPGVKFGGGHRDHAPAVVEIGETKREGAGCGYEDADEDGFGVSQKRQTQTRSHSVWRKNADGDIRRVPRGVDEIEIAPRRTGLQRKIHAVRDCWGAKQYTYHGLTSE